MFSCPSTRFSPRHSTPEGELKRLRMYAGRLAEKIYTYRQDEMSDWSIKDLESSLSFTKGLIESLEMKGAAQRGAA